MVTDSAALVLFAIRSAVKLSQQVRLAVVDATRRRSITLPLPNFFTDTDELDAADWFQSMPQGKRFVEGYEREGRRFPPDARLGELLGRADSWTTEEKRELVDLHIKYRNLVHAEEGGWDWSGGNSGAADPDEVYALLTIQQWRRGTDPTPSTLHRVAGTLVEIGIDYAMSSPDLLDKNSKRGQAIYGFLSALDGLDFKEGDLQELPGRLFVAVLETAAEHRELISGDLRIQEFIKVTTTAVSKDVAVRLKAIREDAALDEIGKDAARAWVQDWAQLVFRSVLGSGGRLVLSDPGRFFGVDDPGRTELISKVGNSLLDLVLAENGKWGRLITREGLETMLKAALEAVGNHPEILSETKNEGVLRLIVGLAEDLRKTNGLLNLDVLPEVVRLVLENTGENLPLFWPDLQHKPEANLLMIAARTTLEILSRPPAEGDTWRPRLRRQDLLEVTEVVIGELVNNPGWLVDKAGKLDRTLRDVVESVLGALRGRADQRLSLSTAVEILKAALRSAALRPEFLKNLPSGGPMILGALLDTVMGTVFAQGQDSAAAWCLIGAQTLEGLVEVVLRVAGTHGVPLNKGAIAQVTEALQQTVQDLLDAKGFSLDGFESLLRQKLTI